MELENHQYEKKDRRKTVGEAEKLRSRYFEMKVKRHKASSISPAAIIIADSN